MTPDVSEHNTGRRILVRLGKDHNSFVLVVDNYRGPDHICPELMEAVDRTLAAKFGDARWKTFTHIEIVRGY